MLEVYYVTLLHLDHNQYIIIKQTNPKLSVKSVISK